MTIKGFGGGALIGAALTALALYLDAAPLEALARVDRSWVELNLGTSVWLFAIVLALFVVNLTRLSQLLGEPAGEPASAALSREIVSLDQLSDVWIHLFVGIGVIWTAVGMRSALQQALADPGDALTDTAGNVLRDLVDGGILLALTTTIVGAIGGYLMRLGKTLSVGPALQERYDAAQSEPMQALIDSAQRIESALAREEQRHALDAS
ncbi:MAG: hypothetical protein AAGI15_13925 [Pseudomonadota bacterium]